MSSQLLAAIRPIKTATIRLMAIPIFPNKRLFKLKGWLVPTMDSGMLTIHGILERRARKRFVRRKTAAINPAEKPIIALALRDFMKISVYPTSEYHHQSVTKETMFNRKIKTAVPIPNIVQDKILFTLNLRIA